MHYSKQSRLTRLDRSLTALRACVRKPAGPGTPTELLRRRRAEVADEQLQREVDDDEGGGGGQPAAARSRRVRVHGARSSLF